MAGVAMVLGGDVVKQVEIATGICTRCGATRNLTGSQDIERHTRRTKGGRRARCQGTGRKPQGWTS